MWVKLKQPFVSGVLCDMLEGEVDYDCYFDSLHNKLTEVSVMTTHTLACLITPHYKLFCLLTILQ